MRLTIESLNKSSERILNNLLVDENSILTEEDEILLSLPLVDFLLRKYNKQEYNSETRYRYIKCLLCDKKFRFKEKYHHKNTLLHKHKIKLCKQEKRSIDDKDIYIEMKEENIN